LSEYFTIQSPTEGLYKEKGSKFLSFAFSVSSQEDIKECRDALRKEYHDARHHCYAWKLGLEHQTTRANDDGEPSHSAGDPILGQIKSFNLTNTLVVVVRYFGGTKLGVGGLISAYKQASEEALSLASKKQLFDMIDFQITFDYPSLSTVERLVTEFNLEISERNFTETCVVLGAIRKELVDRFKERTQDLYELTISINYE